MKRSRGSVDIMALLCIVLLLGGAVVGYFAWSFQGEAVALENRLKQAESDFKLVVELRDSIRDIKLAGGVSAGNETDTIQTFFHETAKDHKFTITKIAPATGIWRNTWNEQSYRLDIKNVTRQQLGNFIADVELKKPFLKSKEIRDVKFDDGHAIQTVTVVFSHFTRIKK